MGRAMRVPPAMRPETRLPTRSVPTDVYRELLLDGVRVVEFGVAAVAPELCGVLSELGHYARGRLAGVLRRAMHADRGETELLWRPSRRHERAVIVVDAEAQKKEEEKK